MKYILSTISILCLMFVAYWFASDSNNDGDSEIKTKLSFTPDSDSQAPDASSEIVRLGKIANGEKVSLEAKAPKDEEIILSQEQAKQQLDSMKEKIDVLVKKYEDNMHDPEARAKVRQEMEAMIEQYDQFALQVAMEKMRNG
jgi:hypothetical protein